MGWNFAITIDWLIDWLIDLCFMPYPQYSSHVTNIKLSRYNYWVSRYNELVSHYNELVVFL